MRRPSYGRVLLFATALWIAGATTRAQTVPAPTVPAERYRALLQQKPAGPVDAAAAPEWAALEVSLRQARHLLTHPSPWPDVPGRLDQVLSRAESALASYACGELPALAAGRQEEGYYSANDGSFQPFERYIPARCLASPKTRAPLVVFLHGYTPFTTVADWPRLPDSLMAFADRNGFILVAPFARGNTDFQGIGEQDVMNVIREAETRYPIDPHRVFLLGYSMGGMGAWTIAAHHPDRFAGIAVISGRGDYYFWQGISREDVPLYKQTLIDREFGYTQLKQLSTLPVFCAHGADDTVIPTAEARHMMTALRKVNRRAVYREVAGGHWAFDGILDRGSVDEWIQACPPRGTPLPAPPPPRGGPIKHAFLAPFLMVCAGDPRETVTAERYARAVGDWSAYANASPRTALESEVSPARLKDVNVLLYGEPETSALIREVLSQSPVRIGSDHYLVGKRKIPRHGNGFMVVRPSPWAKGKLVVVSCGLPWGEGLPPNHKYDLIPDYIIYTSQHDPDGSNTALAAGFFAPDWGLPEPERQKGQPLTRQIQRPRVEEATAPDQHDCMRPSQGCILACATTTCRLTPKGRLHNL